MEMATHQIEIQIMSWQNKNHAQSIIKSMSKGNVSWQFRNMKYYPQAKVLFVVGKSKVRNWWNDWAGLLTAFGDPSNLVCPNLISIKEAVVAASFPLMRIFLPLKNPKYAVTGPYAPVCE